MREIVVKELILSVKIIMFIHSYINFKGNVDNLNKIESYDKGLKKIRNMIYLLTHYPKVATHLSRRKTFSLNVSQMILK